MLPRSGLRGVRGRGCQRRACVAQARGWRWRRSGNLGLRASYRNCLQFMNSVGGRTRLPAMRVRRVTRTASRRMSAVVSPNAPCASCGRPHASGHGLHGAKPSNSAAHAGGTRPRAPSIAAAAARRLDARAALRTRAAPRRGAGRGCTRALGMHDRGGRPLAWARPPPRTRAGGTGCCCAAAAYMPDDPRGARENWQEVSWLGVAPARVRRKATAHGPAAARLGYARHRHVRRPH